jgi:hypothetical protein
VWLHPLQSSVPLVHLLLRGILVGVLFGKLSILVVG